MAKSKLSDLKKLISEMSEDELRQEILKLYNKLSQVKDYYNQDLMSEEERQEVLKGYKSKIYKQFWSSKGNPKEYINNSLLKSIISEYEKIAVFPFDVVDLLIYRVELATDYANQFGGMLDSEYNTSVTAFKKAMKLINENNLRSHFEIRCKEMFKSNNLDYWYIQQLEELFEEGTEDYLEEDSLDIDEKTVYLTPKIIKLK
jgi:hypothetical protein